MEVRIKVLNGLFFLFFLIIFVRLIYWQVLNHEQLAALAKQQYSVLRVVPAPRGKIISQDNFPLVLNVKNYLLFANPQQLLLTPDELEKKLNLVFPGEEINYKTLSDKNLKWVPVAKEVDEEKKKKVQELNIAGIGFEEMEIRFYPEASMAAQLLGFVGEDEKGGIKGYFGLEGYYDNELKGKDGRKYFEQDALGRPIPLGAGWEEKSIPGRTLKLHLDRTIQFLAETHLKKGIEKYGAQAGSVLIMNPKNGAIFAMASFPRYDPNLFFRFDSELYRNPTISSTFEPGSVFKIIIMAAALDSKAVSVNETCLKCDGPRVISDYTIKTWNEKYYPHSSMTDILVHSDNVGMVYVVEKLGLTRLYQYLNNFGFGEKTGIDLQGEATSQVKDKRDWGEIDLATASFGQGIAVTPIAFLTAVSAIANGGEIFKPQVVSEIIEENKGLTLKPSKKKRMINNTTAKLITEMMVQATEKGEAKWAKPKGYKIAGKTGTAQIPIAGHYDPTKTIASFVGFAPAEDPKFSMLVILKEPKTSPWGSETAAPLWFEIAKEILR